MRKRKYYVILSIICLLIIGSIYILQDQKKDDTMKLYKFVDTDNDLTNLPVNAHLTIELTSKNLIYVDSVDETKVYHLDTDSWTETQLDVDPSDTSGDNKSRDLDVQACWHDRDNSIIWFVDCANPGDDFDVWTLNYSSSETSPTATEVGTSTGQDAGTVDVGDIFMISGDVFVVNYEERTSTDYGVVWDVSTSPFVEKDKWGYVDSLYFGFGVVPLGDDKYYTPHYNADVSDRFYIFEYDKSGASINISTAYLSNYTAPSDTKLKGVAYDGDDLLYFIANKSADSNDYLISYSISEDSFTEIGVYAIGFQLERNNEGSAPNPTEKAFDIERDATTNISRIFMLSLKSGKLNKIQEIERNANIRAITDNFIIFE